MVQEHTYNNIIFCNSCNFVASITGINPKRNQFLMMLKMNTKLSIVKLQVLDDGLGGMNQISRVNYVQQQNFLNYNILN